MRWHPHVDGHVPQAPVVAYCGCMSPVLRKRENERMIEWMISIQPPGLMKMSLKLHQEHQPEQYRYAAAAAAWRQQCLWTLFYSQLPAIISSTIDRQPQRLGCSRGRESVKNRGRRAPEVVVAVRV